MLWRTEERTLELPSFELVKDDKPAFARMTKVLHDETSPLNGRRLVQKHGTRLVVVNPPALPLDEAAMDAIYDLPYQRRPHPSYTEAVPAHGMIKDSVTIMRGCFGGCTFCSITMLQGRIIQSRSQDSVLGELRAMAKAPDFKGHVSDIGGPTANMYRMRCTKPEVERVCRRLSCVHPTICKLLGTDHAPLVDPPPTPPPAANPWAQVPTVGHSHNAVPPVGTPSNPQGYPTLPLPDFPPIHRHQLIRPSRQWPNRIRDTECPYPSRRLSRRCRARWRRRYPRQNRAVPGSCGSVLLTTLVITTVSLGVLHWTMQKNFAKYVADVEMQKLDHLIDNLAGVYSTYHDWGNAIQAQILQIEGHAAPDDYDRLFRWWLLRQYDIALQQRYFKENTKTLLSDVSTSEVKHEKHILTEQELQALEENLPSEFQPFEGLKFPLSANQNVFRPDRKKEEIEQESKQNTGKKQFISTPDRLGLSSRLSLYDTQRQFVVGEPSDDQVSFLW